MIDSENPQPGFASMQRSHPEILLQVWQVWAYRCRRVADDKEQVELQAFAPPAPHLLFPSPSLCPHIPRLPGLLHQ
jgi:hypothetical protein